MIRHAGRRCAILASTMLLPGCGSFIDDLDLSQFSPAPSFYGFDLSRLELPEAVSYVELRQGLLLSPQVLASHGDKCAEATDRASCESAFDALTVTEGFGRCPDHDCQKYFAVNRGEDNFTVATLPELAGFFGAVDAPEEALCIASGHGYSWTPGQTDEGGYRAVADGYELIVTRMTSSCDPVERWRYLLHVTAQAEVTEVESEELESSDGCV